MNNLTNFIKFANDDLANAKGTGRLSTLDRDLDIEVVPFTSDNPKAPTHQIFGRSPAGHLIPVGGIWQKINADDKPYFTLTIRDMRFNANLGRMADQDDTSLQAIIPWEPKGQ